MEREDEGQGVEEAREGEELAEEEEEKPEGSTIHQRGNQAGTQVDVEEATTSEPTGEGRREEEEEEHQGKVAPMGKDPMTGSADTGW